MKRYYKYITSIIMLFIIFIFPIASTIKADQYVSNLEARLFQQLPKPSDYTDESGSVSKEAFKDSLLNGEYFKAWDSYFNDQILLRATMVNTYTKIQEATNKRYINGIYIGADDYLFSISNNSVDYIDIQARIDYFNSLQDEFSDSKIYLAAYPSKDVLYSDKVPISGYKSLEKQYLDDILNGLNKDKVNVLDFYEIAKGKEDLYYKTDHHWNMNGTYLGYTSIIDMLRKDFPEIKEANTLDNYTIETYEGNFMGSDGRKIGQAVDELEDIQLYRFDNEDDFTIKVDGVDGHFYYTEYIYSDKTNNDYVAYLKGDNGEIEIINNNPTNDLSIAVIGESMDNPLIPLLADHFESLYSFDMRHYKNDINSRLHELNPDIILINGLPGGFLSKNSTLFKIK